MGSLINKYLIFISIIILFSFGITTLAAPKVNKEPINISYLAYSEFAQEYTYNGEIVSNGMAWLDIDNTIALYESAKLYQFDSDLNLKSSIQINEMPGSSDSSSKTKDTTAIAAIDDDTIIKTLPIPGTDQIYFFTKKKYLPIIKEKDLKEVEDRMNEIKDEQKEYLQSLQTLASEEQSARNKHEIQKSIISPNDYTIQLNEIRKEYVYKREEIEKKMIKLFRKQSALELKNALINKKRFIIEVKLIDTKKNIDIKEFIAPDNFWGIDLLDLDLLTADTNGQLFGYKKEDKRIYTFDYTGELLLSFMVNYNPEKIYIDKNQNIYITNGGEISQFKPIGFARGFLLPSTNNLNVIGSITQETTWQGTINISGEVRVEKNALLAISPGTKIIFSKGASPSLNIFGTLKAIGTKNSYITFVCDTPYPIGQINIYADDKQEASIISYCRFESMQCGVKIFDSSPEISHNIFLNNEAGIWYQGTDINFVNKCIITKNTLKSNLVGMLITFLANGFNPAIEYNNIYENKKTNLIYKNKSNLNISENYWGQEDIQKVRQTIIVEGKEEERININFEPILLVPFDISSED
ncbi:hypothetical protein HZA55_00430 [Candidatus Poribacteria bacterium]|nr:hypothetical protein [Candidatus Poribacteria bacterium]